MVSLSFFEKINRNSLQPPDPATTAAENQRRLESEQRKKHQDTERERKQKEREEREKHKEPEIPRLAGEKRFLNYFFVCGCPPNESLEFLIPRQEGNCV